MKSNSQTPIFLKDYRMPAYWMDTIDLIFELYNEKTIVHSKMQCRQNEKNEIKNVPLVLLGEKLSLLSVHIDGRQLNETEYQVNEQQLNIDKLPPKFTLEIKTEIHPELNSELTGLYRAKNIFCTQCEPQGFRRITYYPDRPDVMAKFTTTIHADKKRYPVLLSNGNCVAKGETDKNRHWVKWEDPFLKPSYLFALVAGDLVSVEDYFVTRSGRLITLKIFVERQNQDKCQHALEALKKSMAWDEATYGREYDLDIYMIVAVNDFNMGAMENKGLNIFNSKYILARPETATDVDYQLIDAVVGHEYFHNWSGNRVTCRDWFQLSLKEGLTVFREHQFAADISLSPVSLIETARYMRSQQFAEDSGPMAHPVRPDSYLEINNFYTSTVYQKGAEVIGMIKTLIGAENFRRGMDLYFERHDGQAVTTDDFVAAMEAASQKDLSQFRLWYTQAGTPEIEVTEQYSEATQNYQLTLKQSCPPTPSQAEKKPMVIPIAIGLLDQKGQELLPQPTIVELKEQQETFTFSSIPYKPVLSILRKFSAPVKIKLERKDSDLAFLLAMDKDDFNRWDAGQQLTEKLILSLVEDIQAGRPLKMQQPWIDAIAAILKDLNINPALKAEILTLPSLSYLIELKKPVDIDALVAARTFCKQKLAEELQDSFLDLYHQYSNSNRYQYAPNDVSARALKNCCLGYLMLGKPGSPGLENCLNQWENANNMTDSLGVLSALCHWEGKERQVILSQFYERWKHDPLVLDKWFRIQALSELPNTLEVVKQLMKDPSFDITNPNKVYSLIGAFSSGNLARFHDKSGAGYSFLADVVLQLDPLNPQVAARMVRAFTTWKRFDKARQDLIRIELERLQAQKNLSKDVFEIVSKSLAG